MRVRNLIRLSVAAAAVSPLAVGQVMQEAYLKGSNTEAGDLFGQIVAISGDTMVVTATGEKSSATGVDGDQTDNIHCCAGAAYVFVRQGGLWVQQAYLKASNTGGTDNFGSSAAISGDTIVIGAVNEDSNATGIDGDGSDNSATTAGAAYVFVRNGTTWSQQAYLKASNTGAGGDWFSIDVAISGDTIVVGAFGEDSSATGVGGNQLDGNASGSGAAYVFTRTGTVWTQEAYLKASNTGANDEFGGSVSLWGDTLAVGAIGEDSGSAGVDGDQGDNSVPDSGAVYVFTRSGTTWSQQAYLKASNPDVDDAFGFSVSLWGDTLVVGAQNEDSHTTGIDGDQTSNSAYDAGAAYVFERQGSTWSQSAYLKPSNTEGGDPPPSGAPFSGDRFGASVSISNDVILVGAPLEDSGATGTNGDESDSGALNSGAAFLFVRSGTSWIQAAYLKASNTGAIDQLGRSVCVSDGTLVIGARGEESNATGVDGDQSDDSSFLAGAAYAFAPDEFCSGDGGDQLGCTDCPCGNDAPAGTIGGCLNSAGSSTRLLVSAHVASVTAADLRFEASAAPPSTNGILVSGTGLASGNPLHPCFGANSGVQSVRYDGLRCLVGGIRRHGLRVSDASGRIGVATSGWDVSSALPNGSVFLPGATRYFQVVYFDDPLAACGTGLNSSQAVGVRFVP